MDRSHYPALRDNPMVIHMDASAAFPIHELVLNAVSKSVMTYVGSAGKSSYDWSYSADGDIAEARQAIATLIGATASQIFFTASASDSARLLYEIIGKRYDHFVFSPEDHTSTIRFFSNQTDVTKLSYGQSGIYDLSSLEDSSNGRPMMFASLVHHMYGSDSDIPALRRLRPDAFIAVDASQAVGRMSVDVNVLGCDALYFSSQKIGGLAGAGVLYIRDPQQDHHALLEPSTLPLTAVVSMAAAASIIEKQDVVKIDMQLIRQSTLLVQQLTERVPGVIFSKGMAHSESRCHNAGIISFKVEGYGSQDIAMILNDHCINVRAADHCVDREAVDRDVIRVSLHAYTTDDDIKRLVDVIADL